ncbi:flagellar biosynthesis protein FlhF [Fibrobacterales bacterium]|nr:flagellar biosynthesis protein FlhF [Fibrobacterales bacterium]
MIKKYRAATFTEAFLQIKEELGADAVILSQKEIKHPSSANEKVEVTVTLDDISESPTNNSARGNDQALGTYNNRGTKQIQTVQWKNVNDEIAIKQGARLPLEPRNDTQNRRETHLMPKIPEKNPMTDSVNKLTDYMENTLAEVKKLREEFSLTRGEFLEGIRVVREGTPKDFNRVAIALTKSGLQAQTVQDLLAESVLLCSPDERDENSIKEKMRKVLANRILIAPRPRLKKGRPLVQMFIGPTGAGKSSLITKLAGRATLTGNPNVAIVSTDTYRMGAIEQLEGFANAAEIDFDKISSPEAVPEVFERLREKSLVLVDTAGRGSGDQEHEEEILALYEAIRPDEVHLVLPLNMRDSDLEKSVEKYSALKANRIVFTKQDESAELGALLWLPLKSQMPLSYICIGQKPDDIVSAEKEIIAEWILK